MSERPTDDVFEEAAETGVCGCLLPDIEDFDSSDDTESDESED